MLYGMPIFSTLKGHGQEVCEFEASLDHKGQHYQKRVSGAGAMAQQLT